ncbi:uncharacterized protein LOC135848765 [Planococcus citri]|uniref:uncharacterized protein LOC135848765 n=1 Tax=Planococcus citri TaxID=170843 RepID=UPI0031F8C0D1
MQKVNSCCCVCSLKTGTLIILILTSIGALLRIRGSFSAPVQIENVIAYITLLCISIVGIYAAMQEKPLFLIPYMAVQLCILVGLIIIMLVYLIVGPAIVVYCVERAVNPEQMEKLKKRDCPTIISVEVICGIFAALGYYFLIVVLSFFKTLRSGSLK